MCDDKWTTACFFVATPWISSDAMNLMVCLMSPSGNQFSRWVKIACEREDMAGEIHPSNVLSVLLEDGPGPGTEVTEREASTSSKEDLSNT